MRIDLMWPAIREYHDHIAQMYPGCAQLEVESEYEGSLPKPGVKIPEVLEIGQPGMKSILRQNNSMITNSRNRNHLQRCYEQFHKGG